MWDLRSSSFVICSNEINPQHSIKRIWHTFFTQRVDTPRLTRILIACDMFHMRKKQSDTFAEQRHHFISTALAARLVRSQLRGRLIDGVPFHSSSPCEVVLFLPQFLYFFWRAPDRQNDRLTDARILFPLFTTTVPFIFAGLAASQTIPGWIRVCTQFICLVSRVGRSPSFPLQYQFVSVFGGNFSRT